MSYWYGSYLMHHGIKGQKWGVRRYQNEDGTLTEEGKKRYNYDKKYSRQEIRKMKKEYAGHWGVDTGIHVHGTAKDFGQSDNDIVKNALKIVTDYEQDYKNLDIQWQKAKYGSKNKQRLEQERKQLIQERDKLIRDYIDNALGKYKNDDVSTRTFGVGPFGERMTTRSTTLEGAIIMDLNKRIREMS